MGKIINLPFGFYLACVIAVGQAEDANGRDRMAVTLEIVQGEWRGYFEAKDKVTNPKYSSRIFSIVIEKNKDQVKSICDLLQLLANMSRPLVAIEVAEIRYDEENKYRNITDIVDWRTCGGLSADAKEWAVKHENDDVEDDTPLAYDLLPYALMYAQAGLRVFPLAVGEKTPLTKRGCKDATANEKQIKQWWEQTPSANIGIATGNGIVVIDVDNGDGKTGEVSIMAWQKNNGFLPATLTARTGSGGRHLLYRTDDKIGNATNIITNVDIRGEGGYIVAPPSVHPNGKKYNWMTEFDASKIVNVDSVVEKFLGGVKKGGKGKGGYAAPSPANAIQLKELYFCEGCRNDSLFRYASSLQSKGLSDDNILKAVNDVNSEKCNPPLSDTEIIAIVGSVTERYPKGSAQRAGILVNCKAEIEDGGVTQYIADMRAAYPYLHIDYNDKVDCFSYKIIPQLLAEHIRCKEHYYFLSGTTGEKPIMLWYNNKKGVYQPCNDNMVKGYIKAYIEILDLEVPKKELCKCIFY